VKTVIVSGALANKPLNGGEAWVRLSWARGLQKLGYRVCFVEQISKATCVDEQGAACPLDHSANLAYFRRVTQAFGLADCAALICDDGSACGVAGEDLDAIASDAHMLINISGHLRLPRFMPKIPRKIYIDIDPGYTQIWNEQGHLPLDGHDFFYTIANNIGRPGCTVPTGKIAWRTILQPVVLEDWPLVAPPTEVKFTTVAAWRGSFGTVTHEGQTFGQKAHEFRKVIELPKISNARFEIALLIHPGDVRDRDALISNGWSLVDPHAVAAEPEEFRRYVQNSSAEFSVAQGMYVQTNSGWFSDRSIRYLATGRPVLVQATGDLGVPVGEGIVTFNSFDEAVAGAEVIVRDYPAHAAAARRLAVDRFDSDKVLTKLCDEVGVRP